MRSFLDPNLLFDSHLLLFFTIYIYDFLGFYSLFDLMLNTNAVVGSSCLLFHKINEWVGGNWSKSTFFSTLNPPSVPKDDNCRKFHPSPDTAALHMYVFPVAHCTRSYPDGWAHFAFLFAPTSRRRFYCKMSSCSIHRTRSAPLSRLTFSLLHLAAAGWSAWMQNFSDNLRSSVRGERVVWDMADRHCRRISVEREIKWIFQWISEHLVQTKRAILGLQWSHATWNDSHRRTSHCTVSASTRWLHSRFLSTRRLLLRLPTRDRRHRHHRRRRHDSYEGFFLHFLLNRFFFRPCVPTRRTR